MDRFTNGTNTEEDELSYNIPEITRESIDAWAESARPTGGFLRAVLSNDLREAFARADFENRAAMFDIVSYCWNEIPALCWGAPANVEGWPVIIKEAEKMRRTFKKSGTDTVEP